MIKKVSLCIVMMASLLLAGCEKGAVVQDEYSNQQAHYVMDFQYGHTTSRLYAAATGINMFCFLSVGTYNTGYTLNSQLYGEEVNKEVVTEQILTKQSRIIGINNCLIVGNSSLQDGGLYVFDGICPNCYLENNVTRNTYMLSFTNSSNVKCSSCGRTYGLLNGGVVVAGANGNKLFRYRASFSGTVFQVVNP